jgi:hypothetical protein
MHRDKIEPDMNRLFWGKPYKIYFEKNLMGTPDCNDIPYRASGIELVNGERRGKVWQRGRVNLC